MIELIISDTPLSELPVEVFLQWVDSSQEGDEIVYLVAENAVDVPVAAAAMTAHKEGKVTLTQRRSATGFEYVAIRRPLRGATKQHLPNTPIRYGRA